MKRFFLIPLLTLMCSVMAWADNVAKIGVTEYATLNAAFTAAQSGNEIQLIDAVSLTASITVSGKTVTLDLAGHNLTMNARQIVVTDNGTLHIKNSSATKATCTSSHSYGNLVLSDGGTSAICTIDGDIDFTNTKSATAPAFNLDGSFGGEASLTFKSGYKGTANNGFLTFAAKAYFEAGCQGRFKRLPDYASDYEIPSTCEFVTVDGYKELSCEMPAVAQIGETEYATFAAALTAAQANDVITLLQDIEVGGLTIDKSIGLAGDHALTVTDNSGFIVGGNSAVTLTLAGVTLNSTYNIRVKQNVTFNIQSSTTNVINKGIQSCDLNSGSTFTISGAGNLTINGSESSMNNVFLLDRLQVEASATNLIVNTGSKGLVNNSAALKAGKYTKMKEAYISDGYESVIDGDYYKVQGNEGRNFLVHNGASRTYYETWAAAYAAANHGDSITLKHSVADAGTISKGIVVYENSRTYANANAGSGYTAVRVGEYNNYVLNSLVEFLNGEGGDSYTLSQSAVLPAADGYKQFTLSGNKTLTIADGVTLSTNVFPATGDTREPIIVPGGAKLTLKGNGTIAADMWLVKVEEGGELVIGEENSNDAVTIVTSLGEGSQNKNWAIENFGTATIHNVNIDARSGAIYNRSNAHMTINKSHIIGRASSVVDGYAAWTYAVINDGIMSLNNAYVQGIHGAVACETGNATLDIRNCDLRAYNTPGKKDAYAALYVATNAVVNVYNTDLYSDRANYAAYIGNNDVYTTFGIINLYSGRLSSKMYVQNLKPTDADFVFPVSIPASSTWYSSFKNYGPLPAGSEYFDIDEDGYKYEVRVTSTDTKEIVDPATTITWQQSSTWKAGESSETTTYVPEETTIVTIPTGKGVVISNDADDNNGVTKAVAEQIFVNQGASLTVESGTTLTVGDGGMNIANGGSITVEPGAVVKIGTAGVITTEKDALVLVSNDDKQAALLYDPTVPQSENTQPKATVKLETKSKQIGDQSYVYERFAIPTLNGAETIYKIEGGIPKTAGKPNETVALYNDAPSFLQAVWAWDNNAGDWQQLNSMLEMKPFNGYQLTNNSANGGLVYVFEGNLVGNNNGTYEFVEDGFHFFGNSYSAEINIRKFLDDLASGAEKSVWLYDPYDKTFKVVTRLTSNGRVTYGDADKTPMKDIRSMQAFIMMLNDGTNATVNYESAIWGNPKYNPSASPAPARETVAEDWATIKVVSANGQKDEFTLVQSEEFSSAFENGADASKFMNKENINLYATTNAGNLAMVATDNIDRTVLAFAAGEATEYTISFEGVEGNEFTLRDIVTGTIVSMTEGATYTFTQEANTTNAARFEIIGIAKTPTAIENVEAEAKTHGIYTIAGQFVGNDFNALSAGVYVVNGVKIVK